MKFSQRIGKTQIKNILQIEWIDDDLKNRLWNIILEIFFNNLSEYAMRDQESPKGNFSKTIWKEFFTLPIDKISQYENGNTYTPGFLKFLREWFYKAQWYEIYDLIEFINYLDENFLQNDFKAFCNTALEKEVAGYRIINSKIVEITSQSEIQAIDNAIENTNELNSVNSHLVTALNLLADRKNPNYRNSIKESISAVEAFCKIITNDNSATLGKALIEIEKKIGLHGALKNSFSALYGYSSDAGGIRHALLENDVEITFEDAKFMLVSCSAFINYLQSKIK